MGPEHPYPAAVDDAISGLQFVQANGPAGPSGAEIVFVGGDSAGGGLTLATLLAARERGLPAGGVWPWTTSCARSRNDPPQPEDVRARWPRPTWVRRRGRPADLACIRRLCSLRCCCRSASLSRSSRTWRSWRSVPGPRGSTRIRWPEMPHVWHASRSCPRGGDRRRARARAYASRGRLSRSRWRRRSARSRRGGVLTEVDDLDAAPVPLEVFGGEASVAFQDRARCRAALSPRQVSSESSAVRGSAGVFRPVCGPCGSRPLGGGRSPSRRCEEEGEVAAALEGRSASAACSAEPTVDPHARSCCADAAGSGELASKVERSVCAEPHRRH